MEILNTILLFVIAAMLFLALDGIAVAERRLRKIEEHLWALREMGCPPEIKPQGVKALFTSPKFQVFRRKGK